MGCGCSDQKQCGAGCGCDTCASTALPARQPARKASRRPRTRATQDRLRALATAQPKQQGRAHPARSELLTAIKPTDCGEGGAAAAWMTPTHTIRPAEPGRAATAPQRLLAAPGAVLPLDCDLQTGLRLCLARARATLSKLPAGRERIPGPTVRYGRGAGLGGRLPEKDPLLSPKGTLRARPAPSEGPVAPVGAAATPAATSQELIFATGALLPLEYRVLADRLQSTDSFQTFTLQWRDVTLTPPVSWFQLYILQVLAQSNDSGGLQALGGVSSTRETIQDLWSDLIAAAAAAGMSYTDAIGNGQLRSGPWSRLRACWSIPVDGSANRDAIFWTDGPGAQYYLFNTVFTLMASYARFIRDPSEAAAFPGEDFPPSPRREDVPLWRTHLAVAGPACEGFDTFVYNTTLYGQATARVAGDLRHPRINVASKANPWDAEYQRWAPDLRYGGNCAHPLPGFGCLAERLQAAEDYYAVNDWRRHRGCEYNYTPKTDSHGGACDNIQAFDAFSYQWDTRASLFRIVPTANNRRELWWSGNRFCETSGGTVRSDTLPVSNHDVYLNAIDVIAQAGILDHIMFLARVARDLATYHAASGQSLSARLNQKWGGQLARYALRPLLETGRVWIHELGHLYMPAGGHCRWGCCFEVAGREWICRTVGALGLPPAAFGARLSGQPPVWVARESTLSDSFISHYTDFSGNPVLWWTTAKETGGTDDAVRLREFLVDGDPAPTRYGSLECTSAYGCAFQSTGTPGAESWFIHMASSCADDDGVTRVDFAYFGSVPAIDP